MVNSSSNANKGYSYGEKSQPSNSATSTTEKTRSSKGADGATSKHIIEKDATGNKVSKTHQVKMVILSISIKILLIKIVRKEKKQNIDNFQMSGSSIQILKNDAK